MVYRYKQAYCEIYLERYEHQNEHNNLKEKNNVGGVTPTDMRPVI